MPDTYIEKLNRICVQPVQVLGVAHDSPIAWSPTGKRLAFAAGNNSIFVCIVTGDMQGVRLEKIIPVFKKTIRLILFYADRDDFLAIGGEEGLAFVNVETGEAVDMIGLGEQNNHESDITCGCWMYGGRVLATGSKDATIKLWVQDYADSTAWLCLETLAAHKAPLLALNFNLKTESLFSSGRDSSIKNWDVRSVHPQRIQKRLDDGSITCAVQSTMEGHQGDVVTLTVVENGKILFSGARDNSIKVWNVAQRREIRSITGHTGDIRRLILMSSDTLLYSASADGTIRLVKLLDLEIESDIQLSAEDVERDREAADKLALEEILGLDTTTTAATNKNNSNGNSQVMNMQSRDEVLAAFSAHEEHVFRMEVNPCQPLMATAGNHELRIWHIANIAKPVLMNEIVGHTGGISYLELIGNEQRLITSSLDGRVHSYTMGSIHRTSKLDIGCAVGAMKMAPDGRFLFCSGGDYDIRGFMVQDGNITMQCSVELSGHAGKVYCIATSPDGTIMASGAHDYTLCLWSLADLSRSTSDPTRPLIASPDNIQRLKPAKRVQSSHEGHVLQVAFSQPVPLTSQQLRLASCGNDHSIKVWKIATYGANNSSIDVREICHLRDAHVSTISALTWGRGQASSHLLFSGGWDHLIKVWDLSNTTGQRNAPKASLAILESHQGRVSNLKVNGDGTVLVSTCADGTMMLWQATHPFMLLCTYVAMDAGASSMDVGRNIIATGYDDGMIRIWPIMRNDGTFNNEYAHLLLTQENLEKMKSENALRAKQGSMILAGRKKTPFAPPPQN